MKNKIYKKIININIKINTLIWKIFIKKIGPDTKVLGHIKVTNPTNVEIGKNSVINDGVILNSRENIKIGEHVHISYHCIINTGGLDYNKYKNERAHISKPVVIKDGVWIGSSVVINPGVTIGENSVIGAGSIVTKNIPPYSLAFGNPAKVFKTI